MKPGIRTLSIFFCGAAAGALVWPALIRSSSRTQVTVATPPPIAAREQWTEASLSSALAAIASAGSDEARIEAAIRLGKIPAAEIEAALEGIPLTDSNGLTLACRTLLIRWAEADGEAAMRWGWAKFYKQGMWYAAFREIGPSWAWNDPQGFYLWTLDSPRKDMSDEIAQDRKAAASDIPFLDYSELSQASGWLLKERPDLALDLRNRSGGWSTSDYKLVEQIDSVEKVQQALQACKGLDQLKPGIVQGDQMIAWSLLERWKELDPVGFSKSPHANLLMSDNFSAFAAKAKDWSKTPSGDREEAAAALLTNLTGIGRQSQIYTLAREWAAISPVEAAAWLDAQEEGTKGIAAIAQGGILKNSTGTMQWIATRPPADQAKLIVASYDAWKESGLSQAPDMSDWTPAQVEAWRDLDSLAE
ncbi:hypothetical protein OJ996_10815 [Luteolibacter sp. GHJ8]|uniref:Uncharacterized protein n=1 Tax=Luteolibacter rhizosphaerae TaxID=2989719 RepID=A0ABT3G3K3_9BACT|nr:hypothetical protein [Luteolibacter rhizosphaerae]MCW1914069.1 hypothetical protein [Luteolibacter rhizosphaerae]